MDLSAAPRPEFDAFWLRYLRDHADPRTRAMHHAGIILALLCIKLALAFGPLAAFLAAAPVAAYGLAWVSHAVFERNKPTAFGHPFWSLAASFKMFGLWICGRLDAELGRAGLAVSLPTRNTAPSRR